MRDQLFAIGNAIRAGLLPDARLENLLGPAAADTQDAFDGGPIDPGVGKCA